MDIDFWVRFSMLGRELASSIVRMLSEAMLSIGRSWNSLLEDELEQLIRYVEGAHTL